MSDALYSHAILQVFQSRSNCKGSKCGCCFNALLVSSFLIACSNIISLRDPRAEVSREVGVVEVIYLAMKCDMFAFCCELELEQ